MTFRSVMKLQLIPGWMSILCSLTCAQSFDVASVRPLPPSTQPPVFRFDRLPGNREIRATTQLTTLMRMIYHTPFDCIVVKARGASWADHEWWELHAKSEKPFSESEMTVMLQNLLAERFRLLIEKEEKLGTIYVMTVDYGGLKIKESEDATTHPWVEFTAEGRGGTANMVLYARAITIGRLIFTAPFINLRAPVVDATGLTGRYDIHWVLGEAGDVNPPLTAPSVIETCKRQLGLKLEATKGQIDIINITRVEKPEN